MEKNVQNAYIFLHPHSYELNINCLSFMCLNAFTEDNIKEKK